jgi:hypothetical protein
MNEMRLFSTNNNKIQLTPEQIAIEVAKVEKYKLFIRQPGDILHINYYIVFMDDFFFFFNIQCVNTVYSLYNHAFMFV